MDWLMDFLGLNKGKATIDAANTNRADLGRTGVDLNNIIAETDASQRGHLNDSLGLVSLGEGGEGMIRDALGLGGGDGKARAMAAFQDTNPGYQFQMDQGLDAIDRRAASRGMLGSGNTNLDTINYASGVADQSFGNWFDRLTQGVDRQTGVLGDMTTQAGNTGATKLGVTGSLGSARMQLNNQEAAGREAGQGGFWDILDGIAGAAGAFTDMGSGGGYGRPQGNGMGGQHQVPPQLGYGGGF
jgi:hypothetical protein